MEDAQGNEINGVQVFVCFIFVLAEVPVIFVKSKEARGRDGVADNRRGVFVLMQPKKPHERSCFSL